MDSSLWNRNLDWIVRVFGWFCLLQLRCLRQSSVVGILKISIANLFMHCSRLWKVSSLHVLQVWICCVFMCFMNVLCCLCFSRLDRVEVVLEKYVLLISRFSILWLEVLQCFLVFCCSIVGQEQPIICSRGNSLLILVVNCFCGGDFFRLLLWKFLRCHCICGCLKLT